MGLGGGVEAKVGGGMRTPMEMQCCSPQYRWNHKRHRQEGCSHQHKAHHRNQIWPGILLCCCADGHGSNDEGHHKTTITGSLNSGQGCMGLVTAGGEGKRPRIGVSSVRTVSDHCEKEPKTGWTAVRTADADTKQDGQKSAKGPPTPSPEEGETEEQAMRIFHEIIKTF